MENILFREFMEDIMVERIERDYDFNMVSKHFHKEYEIYYLLEGERYYFIDKQTYHVKKGSIVFIDQNQIHKTVGSTMHYHDRMLIQFREKTLKRIFLPLSKLNYSNDLSECFGVLELNDVGQEYVERLLFTLANEMKEKKIGYEYLVNNIVSELLIFILRCKRGDCSSFRAKAVTTEKHKKIHEIAEYINLHYKDKISLDDLSKYFYVSKSYLSRIYKEVTGFTVNEYINIVRIKRAKILLEQSEKTIAEVAQDVGYDSITYFEKVFKNYMETTPLKYRKYYK